MPIQGLMLSGSTHGQPIKVAATSIAGPGTLIHTATTETADGKFDAIYLWITNTHTAAVTVTIGFGGTTDPDHLIVDALSVPPNIAPFMVVAGQRLRNGLIVRAAASTTNVILISGFVNRS